MIPNGKPTIIQGAYDALILLLNIFFLLFLITILWARGKFQ